MLHTFHCHVTIHVNRPFTSSQNLPFVLRSFPHVQSDNGFNKESSKSCQEEPVVMSPVPSEPSHDQIESDETVQGENDAGEKRRQHWTALTLL